MRTTTKSNGTGGCGAAVSRCCDGGDGSERATSDPAARQVSAAVAPRRHADPPATGAAAVAVPRGPTQVATGRGSLLRRLNATATSFAPAPRVRALVCVCVRVVFVLACDVVAILRVSHPPSLPLPLVLEGFLSQTRRARESALARGPRLRDGSYTYSGDGGFNSSVGDMVVLGRDPAEAGSYDTSDDSLYGLCMEFNLLGLPFGRPALTLSPFPPAAHV